MLDRDKCKHVAKLEGMLNKFGINFELTVDRETKKLQFRDLTGPEKLVLMKNFKAVELMGDEARARTIQTIWDDFRDLNEMFRSENPDPDVIEVKAKVWCSDLLMHSKQGI